MQKTTLLASLQQKRPLCYEALNSFAHLLSSKTLVAEASKMLATVEFDKHTAQFSFFYSDIYTASDLMTEHKFTSLQVVTASNAAGGYSPNPYFALMRSGHITHQNLDEFCKLFASSSDKQSLLVMAVPLIQADLILWHEILEHRKRVEMIFAQNIINFKQLVKTRKQFLATDAQELNRLAQLSMVDPKLYAEKEIASITLDEIAQLRAKTELLQKQVVEEKDQATATKVTTKLTDAEVEQCLSAGKNVLRLVNEGFLSLNECLKLGPLEIKVFNTVADCILGNLISIKTIKQFSMEIYEEINVVSRSQQTMDIIFVTPNHDLRASKSAVRGKYETRALIFATPKLIELRNAALKNKTVAEAVPILPEPIVDLVVRYSM